MNQDPWPDRKGDSPDGDPPNIPNDLLKRFHDANERFSQAKQGLDGMLDGHERAPGQRGKVSGELHAAEEEVEQIAREINEVLKLPDPPPATPPPNPA